MIRATSGLNRPPALRPGDRVAIIAPASPFDREAFESGVREIEALGYEPLVDERTFAREGFVAGAPALRAAHFMDAWTRPDVHGILCARGGYGSVQMLPHLDPHRLRGQPKVFVGYSDVTTLLSYLSQECGHVAFHGPMVVGRFSAGEAGYDRASLLAAVATPEPMGDIGGVLGALHEGEAVGPLWGGTLTQLLMSLGTPYAFTLPAGSVLFIDEVNERPYRLDRMLVQLRQSGLLRRAAALVFGDLPGCDEPTGTPRALETIARALDDFEGPILWGVPSGHTPRPAVTLPIGVTARVVARGVPRLIIEEAAVSWRTVAS